MSYSAINLMERAAPTASYIFDVEVTNLRPKRDPQQVSLDWLARLSRMSSRESERSLASWYEAD